MRQSLARAARIDDEADDLLGELQQTLARLADVEMRHEVECEQIAAGSGPATDKDRLSEACEHRYHLAREPYLRRLNELQHQTRLRILGDL